MPSTVHVNIAGLRAYRDAVRRQLESGALSGALGDMLKQWAARYLGFSRRRFNRFSRGGGDWPALAHSTIAARARRKFGRVRMKKNRLTGLMDFVKSYSAPRNIKMGPRVSMTSVGRGRKRKAVGITVSILRDTGTLLNALTFGNPGNIVKGRRGGIDVGFGGPARHGKGQGASIVDIAWFHHSGAGHLPRRRILVDPDDRTRRSMIADGQRALQRLASEAGQAMAAAGGGA